MQMNDYQDSKVKMPGNIPAPATRSTLAGRVGEDLPLILTKKWLCFKFGICYTSGRASQRLRKLVFDNHLLELLQMPEQEWKRRQEFTRAETVLIINYLQL